MNALLLFDIDATLLATGGLGVRAMQEAGGELFGPRFTTAGLDFAGRLDPLLVRELFVNNSLTLTHDREREFRSAYGRRLERLLADSAGRRPLPGVLALLDRLEREPGVSLGLLTGNFAETGCMKLRAFGIDPARFCVAAWGDDSPHDPPARDHLPPVAVQRFQERFGLGLGCGRVTIIGDTPHDVACARVNGCRVLGVATGRYPVQSLAAAGADRVVADLSETDDLATWLLETAVERPAAKTAKA